MALLRNLRGTKRTIVPIACTVVMLAAAFYAGVRSGVARSTSHLFINLTGLTAALSSQVHGLEDHPYQGFVVVREALQQAGMFVGAENGHVASDFSTNFRKYGVLSAALRMASNVDACGSRLVGHAFNDQGLVEFVHASFRIFGRDVHSMYYFYFTLLALSMTVFVATFRRSYVACTLLFACAFAVYAFMPTYITADDQLISVSNPRFLSTLGLIPLLHLLLMLFGDRSARLSAWSLTGVLVQAALLSFAITIRSTAQWMEIAFAAAIGVCLLRGVIRSAAARTAAAIRQFVMRQGAVALYVLATFAIIASVRGFYIPANCGTALNAHTFWHNVYLGLTLHPDFVAKYRGPMGLADVEGDSISFTEARLYAIRHHLPYQTQPGIWITTNETAMSGADAMPFGSWEIYEQVMRAASFEFARAHPRYIAGVFFVYKPQLLKMHLENFWRTVAHDLSNWKRFALVAVLIAAIAAFGSSSTRDDDAGEADVLTGWGVFGVVAFCFVMSTSPLLIVYPDSFLIADPAYLMTAAAMLAAIGLVSSAFRLVPRVRSVR